jgi:hypothetical protein
VRERCRRVKARPSVPWLSWRWCAHARRMQVLALLADRVPFVVLLDILPTLVGAAPAPSAHTAASRAREKFVECVRSAAPASLAESAAVVLEQRAVARVRVRLLS